MQTVVHLRDCHVLLSGEFSTWALQSIGTNCSLLTQLQHTFHNDDCDDTQAKHNLISAICMHTHPQRVCYPTKWTNSTWKSDAMHEHGQQHTAVSLNCPQEWSIAMQGCCANC